MRRTESQEQVAIFDWVEIKKKNWPELGLLYHIPNGGYRLARTAARLKREGVQPGVPDLCLPVPRGKWHGLYMELKAEKGTVSKAQREWFNALREQGYFVSICWGAEAAIDSISEYLKGRL